jgi:hypothetical protein
VAGSGGSVAGSGGSVAGSGGSVAGSDGSSGSGGATISPSSVCYGATKVLDPAVEAFVDDFEELDGKVLGGWYAYNDVVPADGVKPTIEVGGAATSAHALQYLLSGVKSPSSGGYGAGLVWGLLPAAIKCVDVSQFDGVTFWAKLGPTAGANAQIYFKVATPETNKTPDGDCVPKADGSGCYNPANVIIALTASWVQHAVKFTDLTGGQLPNGTKPTFAKIAQQLVWASDGPAVDFQIDEIAFFKGTAPTGPVKK